MNDTRKFSLGKAPFIRRADRNDASTSAFMLDLLIALVPLVLFAWVKNGLLPYLDKNATFIEMLYPLILVLCGGAFSLLLEYLWYLLIIKNKPVQDRLKTSYAPIPGILLAMMLPLSTPIWALFLGTIFATVIAKLMFGGFGHNVFNPALVGYLFLTYAYFGVITGENSIGFLNGNEKIITGATPLVEFAADRFGSVPALIEKYGLLKMFIGFRPGSLAETSALLCIVALVYLLVRKVINWRIPVIYIGTVFVLTYIIGAFNGYADTLDFALFGLFNGGLMFGAVFMATEPVTSPRNPNGKVIYALFLGVLTVVFRFASKTPEGVATSILIMNMFTALIEGAASKLRVEPVKRKAILSYTLIGVLFLGIALFPIVKSLPSKEVTYEYVSSKQNYDSLNFEYVVKADDVEFKVTTDQTGKIVNINNPDFNNDTAKLSINEIIKQNLIVNYVVKFEETVDTLVVYTNTKAYNSNPINSVVTFDNDGKIVQFVSTYTESYDDEYNDIWNGEHPKDVLPGRIIANQDDLTKVTPVTGATVTSAGMINAAKVAKDFANNLSSISTLKLVGKSQDFETLGFVYIFRSASGKLIVKTNKDYVITSDVDAAIKADVEAKIASSKIFDYIVSATDTKIVVTTDGFHGAITTTFTYDESFSIITVSSSTGDESYEQYEGWSGQHPYIVLPPKIVENQDDLSKVPVVTGATITSKAILSASKIAINYLKYLEANNE